MLEVPFFHHFLVLLNTHPPTYAVPKHYGRITCEKCSWFIKTTYYVKVYLYI